MKVKSVCCFLALFWMVAFPSVGERQEWKGSFASTMYRFDNFWGLPNWTPVTGSLRFAFLISDKEDNAQIEMEYSGPFRHSERVEIEISLPDFKKMHLGSTFKFPVPTVSEEMIWKITEYSDAFIAGTYRSANPPDAGTFELRHTQHYSRQN